MTEASATTTNIADGAAQVGVQAQAVHGDVNVYQAPPDPSPLQNYELGVRYLDGGMPDQARELIRAAIMDGYVTTESCFHWLIALLSGRTLQQLSQDDMAELRDAPQRFSLATSDQWTEGMEVIRRLLDSPGTPGDRQAADGNLATRLREFDELGETQRDMILRHLELFLKGPLQDQVWERAFKQAAQKQRGERREELVWKFFQPKPAEARVRWPRPITTTLRDWLRAGAATAVLLAAAAYIGSLALQRSRPSVVLASMLIAVGGGCCGWAGIEWRFRIERREAKDAQLRVPWRRTGSVPETGFAREVDRLFDRYFARYAPDRGERERWLAKTAGIRQSLRDELVEVYRESRIGAERIAWLVRYLVSDVKRRWQAGTLLEHHKLLRTPPIVKTAFILGLPALVTGSIWMIDSAARLRPVSAVGIALIAALSCWIAATTWLRIVLEHRRFIAERAEAEQRRKDREEALERWRRKLADKPSDLQMAKWMDYDRKCLMNKAMQHYKLAPSKIISHAFIEAPAAPRRQSRVRNGPWRYSRYKLLIFLLTPDGVRQMTVDLDFEKATFHDPRRTNYRFDAVAAVWVTEADDGRTTFELTLINGQTIKVDVKGPDTGTVQLGEDPHKIAAATLDAAGLASTLHVLEGVAAEGKDWISHERRREENRLATLTEAMHSMLTDKAERRPATLKGRGPT